VSLQATRRRRQALFRRVVVAVIGLFFALPLIAMLEFTTRAPGGGRSLETWATLVDVGTVDRDYPELRTGLIASAGLAVLTVAIMLVLLVPTMTWVRLRLPGLRRTVEFVCLLPLTIPAIVLVVGLAPVYAWVTYFLGESSVWLCFAYVVLVLPYAYRALDAGLGAIDVRTLAEAARSLGASWFIVMWRVILPNVRTAVLLSAFLSVALVLGEFTIASLLNRPAFGPYLQNVGANKAYEPAALAIIAFAVTWACMGLINVFGRGPGGIMARKKN
jgi:putative spermidine/putrescine transport system permease protein